MDATLDTSLWTSFAAIAGLWLITVISPGPNFVATSHAAVTHSRRAGVLVAAGIALGTTVWSTASLLGLGLLFQTAAWLYQVVKLAGAAYLVYVGVRMIAARTTAVSAGPSVRGLSAIGAFRRGVQIDLSNPQAAAFFTSLFAVAVPPEAPFWFQATIVGTVVVMAGGWYAIVACAMASTPVAALYRRAQRTILRLTGALFVVFGVRLAVER